jgi:nitroimidazol reductase NimA-like FMN-containing flavoprotein (pyridoxamine 5'-phosphate oxidase superfamily)
MNTPLAGPDGIDQVAQSQGTMEILTAEECWSLLAVTEVGRLAVHAAGDVDIFPLNFAVDEGSLVFKTSEGTKLVEVVLSSRVAFEIDGYEPEHGRAWSVVVKGLARDIDSFTERYRAEKVLVIPWNAAPKERYIRMEVSEVSGRRFTVATTRDGSTPHL